MRRLPAKIGFVFVYLLACAGAHSALHHRAGRPAARAQSGDVGHFFEDINLGAMAGFTRIGEEPRVLISQLRVMGWSKLSPARRAAIVVHDENPFNVANPHYLRIESQGKTCWVANEGFRGIGVAGARLQLLGPNRNVAGKPSRG